MATDKCKPENKYPPKPCPCPEIPGPKGDPGNNGTNGAPGPCSDTCVFAVRIRGSQGSQGSITLTATPIGGSGNFTYFWTNLSSTYITNGLIAPNQIIITNSVTAIETATPTLAFSEGMVSCEVTDTVSNIVSIGYHYVNFSTN